MNTEPEVQDNREDKPSASGFDRIYHCPGSVAAERGLPPLPEAKVTAFGTKVHEMLESGEDEDAEVSEKEIAENLRVMEAGALAEWREFARGREEVNEELDGPHREKRLWIRRNGTGEKLASARLDVFYIYGSHAWICDYKTGFKDVTASERNLQLRCQAVCVSQNYPQVKHIRAATAHSRLSSKWDSCDYDSGDIAKVERELNFTLWRAEQEDAPRVPGSHCRYCRASGLCREAAVHAIVVQHAWPTDQLEAIEHTKRMSPGELAYVYGREGHAKMVFDAVEAMLKSLPADVLLKVGYLLVPGNKLREITDTATAFSRLKALLEDGRMRCIKILRSKAAELLAEKCGQSKKRCQETIDEALGDVLIEKTGNPRLKKVA